MNDIFEHEFFEDAIEDVGYEYDDYDDAYEDVDVFDEDYFEAMEGPARDYRHKQRSLKSPDQIREDRARNYLKQTHYHSEPRRHENTIQNSRQIENQRLRGEGVYGYQQYYFARGGPGGRATASEYSKWRDNRHQRGLYYTGPYDTIPEYNKRAGIRNGVVKPAK